LRAGCQVLGNAQRLQAWTAVILLLTVVVSAIPLRLTVDHKIAELSPA